jgi:imidazolonepropionase-like amidohydrolase
MKNYRRSLSGLLALLVAACGLLRPAASPSSIAPAATRVPATPTAAALTPPTTVPSPATVLTPTPRPLVLDMGGSGLVALTHASVIDGTGAAPLRDWTVLIGDGRIVDLGPNLAIPEAAYVVDLTGKTIVPGLFDMHGHLYANDGSRIATQFDSYPILYLAGGVTTIFTAGDFDPEGAVALRDRIENGEAIGPHVLTAGPYFDGLRERSGWIPGSDSVANLMAKYEAWRGRIDGVKVYIGITEEQLSALIQATQADGLPITGHLESVTARRAIALGIDGLEHGIFSMSEFWPRGSTFRGQYCALAEVDVNGPAMQDLITAIVDRGVYVTPTLIVWQAALADFQPVPADWESYVAPAAREPVRNLVRAISLDAGECLKEALNRQGQFVKAVHDRGGRIVAGTDPVLPMLLPGYGIHHELKNLVDAGLSPLDAIRAASFTAASVLGLQDERGTIAAGKAADLVVVDGDPSADIGAMLNTVMVFKAGIAYDPAGLRESVLGAIGD